jgi:hypothetical protein
MDLRKDMLDDVTGRGWLALVIESVPPASHHENEEASADLLSSVSRLFTPFPIECATVDGL